ncbi:MAG: hypothetical protein V4582_16305 [Pseudomonadota bacterium]
MKIGLTRMDAKAGMPRSAAHALVRPLFVSVLLACAGMSGALAGEGKDKPHAQQREQRAEMRVERQAEARAERQAERQAQQQQQRGAEGRPADGRGLPMQGERGHNRLTPDERRDLRRQINEAGQDIYNRSPRR